MEAGGDLGTAPCLQVLSLQSWTAPSEGIWSPGEEGEVAMVNAGCQLGNPYYYLQGTTCEGSYLD